MFEYNSSEELSRRHSADAFKIAEKKQETDMTLQKKRLFAVIDKYIEKYSSTTSVRDEAKSHGRTNDYQLDLSADIVTILKEIKGTMK